MALTRVRGKSKGLEPRVGHTQKDWGKAEAVQVGVAWDMTGS